MQSSIHYGRANPPRGHLREVVNGVLARTIDDKGWSDYDCNSANKHWSHESLLGPRHRNGPLQNSQQFGHHTEKRAKSLPSQFGQKYDHNSARNTLQEAVGFLNGQLDIDPVPSKLDELFATFSQYDIDFSDVRGQDMAKRALTIAAAGSHSLLMLGPPGSGETEYMTSGSSHDTAMLA